MEAGLGNIRIRPENKNDYDQVYAVHFDAFGNRNDESKLAPEKIRRDREAYDKGNRPTVG